MTTRDSDPLSALRILAARYVLQMLQNRDLPRAADIALSKSIYSDALAELAAVTGQYPAWEEVGPLFLQALEELGIPQPSRVEAAWQVARDCMARILNKDERPVEVLAVLRDMVWSIQDALPDDKYVGSGLDVAQLIGLSWSYTEPNENYCAAENRIITDEGERQALLDTLSRKEASAWLERHPQS